MLETDKQYLFLGQSYKHIVNNTNLYERLTHPPFKIKLDEKKQSLALVLPDSGDVLATISDRYYLAGWEDIENGGFRAVFQHIYNKSYSGQYPEFVILNQPWDERSTSAGIKLHEAESRWRQLPSFFRLLSAASLILHRSVELCTIS